jgi:hypothetical protein
VKTTIGNQRPLTGEIHFSRKLYETPGRAKLAAFDAMIFRQSYNMAAPIRVMRRPEVGPGIGPKGTAYGKGQQY